MMAFEKELEVAKDIALKAGGIMLEYFDDELTVEHKHETPENPEVTIADKKINRLVIEELSKNFSDGIIGEEESTAGYGNGRKWFCDPIDGTKAFINGIPTAMFSLGLVIDGKPVMGVLYDPFLDKIYWGSKGRGSYCNSTKLQVSKNPLKGHYVGVCNNLEKIVEDPELINKLAIKGAKFASINGAVYMVCLIAQRRLVGYIEPHLNAHDIAAAQIILEEAGGKVSGYDGKPMDYSKPFKGAIISNGVAHEDLMESVR